MTRSNKTLKKGAGRHRPKFELPRRGPGGAKSVRATTEFEISKKHVFKKITLFFEICDTTVDTRCQTETVPERAKSHRTI